MASFQLRAPVIWAIALQGEEREHVQNVSNNLDALARAVDSFNDAVELFQLMDFNRAEAHKDKDRPAMFKSISWMGIAARDGAICLQSYYRVMQSCNGSLSKCGSLAKHFDAEAKKRADKGFQNAFPGIADLRDSAAHPIDMARTSAEARRHATSITNQAAYEINPGSPIYMQGDIHGDQFVSSVKGKEVSYGVNNASVRALAEITTNFFAAFEPFSAATTALLDSNREEILRRLKGS